HAPHQSCELHDPEPSPRPADSARRLAPKVIIRDTKRGTLTDDIHPARFVGHDHATCRGIERGLTRPAAGGKRDDRSAAAWVDDDHPAIERTGHIQRSG